MANFLAGVGTGSADTATNALVSQQQQQNQLDQTYANHMAATYDQYQTSRKQANDEANRQSNMVDQLQKTTGLPYDLALDAHSRNYNSQTGTYNQDGIDQYVQAYKKGQIKQNPDTQQGTQQTGGQPQPTQQNETADYSNTGSKTNWLGQAVGPGRTVRKFEQSMGLPPGEYNRQVNEPLPLTTPQHSTNFGGITRSPGAGVTPEMASTMIAKLVQSNILPESEAKGAINDVATNGAVDPTRFKRTMSPAEAQEASLRSKQFLLSVSDSASRLVADGNMDPKETGAYINSVITNHMPDLSKVQPTTKIVPTSTGGVATFKPSVNGDNDGGVNVIQPPTTTKEMYEKFRERVNSNSDAFDANLEAHTLLTQNPQAAGIVGELGAKYGGVVLSGLKMVGETGLEKQLDGYVQSDASGRTRAALVNAEAKTLQYLKSNKGGLGNGVNMDHVENDLEGALNGTGSQVRALAGLSQVNKMIASETLRYIGQIEIDPKTGKSALPNLVGADGKPDMGQFHALTTSLMDQGRYGLSKDMAQMVAATLYQKQSGNGQ